MFDINRKNTNDNVSTKELLINIALMDVTVSPVDLN